MTKMPTDPPNDIADNCLNYTINILTSIRDVSTEAWDACIDGSYPFAKHAFLSALETSNSANADTGWLGQHIIMKNTHDQVIGAAPMYLKNHSYGEYVFDHAWANAFEQAGGRYYPKLQMSIPFTPAAGPRILLNRTAILSGNLDEREVYKTLLSACISRCEQVGASSLHVTFPNKYQAQMMQNCGLMLRKGIQYHWENEGYNNFDDFLNSLTSRKRKQIRRERKEASASGLHINILSGDEIKEHHWDAFFTFYRHTSGRKWGVPYLTREFFSLLCEKMSHQIVLIIVENGSRPIAGALNLKSDEILYGRYWGAIEFHKFLHFEVCYYQAIDYALASGLKSVEAGAQGEHKLIRGYLPCQTYSAHWIANTSFREAIQKYLEQETQNIGEEMSFLDSLTPFKTSN